MKREEAQAILQREGLTRYNWYGDHPVAPALSTFTMTDCVFMLL